MGRSPLPASQLAPSTLGKNPARLLKRMAEPNYPPCNPNPPDNFEEKETAKWTYYFNLLNAQGVITAADYDTLASYCKTLVDSDRIRKALSTEGLTFMTDKGEVKKHPLLSVLHQTAAREATLAVQLGLTPASRSRTKALNQDAEKHNAFAEEESGL